MKYIFEALVLLTVWYFLAKASLTETEFWLFRWIVALAVAVVSPSLMWSYIISEVAKSWGWA